MLCYDCIGCWYKDQDFEFEDGEEHPGNSEHCRCFRKKPSTKRKAMKLFPGHGLGNTSIIEKKEGEDGVR